MNQKIDILVVAPNLDGGVGKVVLNLVKAFRNEKLSVEVIDFGSGQYKKNVEEYVRVHNFSSGRAFAKIHQLSLFLLRNSVRSILTNVHYINLITILAKLLCRSKSELVAVEHIAVSKSISKNKIKKKTIIIMLQLMYSVPKAVVAVSDAAADDLIREIKKKPKSMTVIYNPILNADFYENAQNDNPYNDESDKRKTVVSVGRLCEQKDQSTLLQAFAKLKKKEEYRMLLVGHGPDYNKLLTLAGSLGIEGQIVFCGHEENPLPIIRDADCFVLSSRWEGLPTVLIEAVALGTPVVATDCPTGPREILYGVRSASIVEVADARAMASAIEHMCSTQRTEPPEEWYRRFEECHIVQNYLRLLGLR